MLTTGQLRDVAVTLSLEPGRVMLYVRAADKPGVNYPLQLDPVLADAIRELAWRWCHHDDAPADRPLPRRG